MKSLFLGIILTLSNIGFAELNSDIIIGAEAEQLFNSLAGNYEYSTGVSTSGIQYKLIVRHDEKITCEKEVTTYTNSEIIETDFKCEIKSK